MRGMVGYEDGMYLLSISFPPFLCPHNLSVDKAGIGGK